MQLHNLVSSILIKKSIDRETNRAKEYSKLIDELIYGSDKKQTPETV
jgi:ribosomal protein L17